MLKQGLKTNFLKHVFQFPMHMWKHMFQDGEAYRLKGTIVSNIHNEYGNNENDHDIEIQFQKLEKTIRLDNGSDDDDNDDSTTGSDDDDDDDITRSDDVYNNINININNDDGVKDVINGSFNFILKQIMEFNGSETNQFIISNLLQFLNSLIKFENKKIQKNLFKGQLKNVMNGGIHRNGEAHYDVEKEKIRNLCKIKLDKIINKLFSILRMNDQDDTKIDDSNAAIPSKYSLLCLQSYFQTDPSEIFMKFKNIGPKK
ncbi:hypothetical protein M9Y10_019623 [Tritrichomonas musculus]|uniref:Uncharacterized protein n=1 Tax=Tritrichomonas musculus TaxID=1915356 RepID=A0ABR2HH02_9EUKA